MMKSTAKPIVILDTNEFVFGLVGNQKHPTLLIQNLGKLRQNFDFRVSRQIIKEILGNIPKNYQGKLFDLINSGMIKYDDKLVGEKLLVKYKTHGLKKGDAVIAAFADKENADILISENRHFLKELKTKRFNVMNAEQFLNEIIKFK